MRASPACGKPRWSLGAALVGLALLCCAFDSTALTLGRLQGGAFLGKALNVVVPVQLDVGEDASSLCFEADVFHADTRQGSSRVQVEAGLQPRTAELRILSAAPIDEPVVTVYLRGGCAGQRTTRRYVLLTDLPVEAASVALPSVSTPSPLTAPNEAGQSQPSQAVTAGAPTPQAAPAGPSAKVKASRPARSVRLRMPARVQRGMATGALPPPGAALQPSKPARAGGQARLQLDPLEYFSDRIANLEAPAPVTQESSALLTAQRMEALETSVKTLQAVASQNEARLSDLKTRLQQAESERFAPAVVYALLALLFASLLALGWLWKRQRDARAASEPWWSDSLQVPAAAPASALDAPDVTPAPARTASAAPDAAALDVDLVDLNESGYDIFMAPEANEPTEQPGPESEAPLPALTPAPARQLNFDTRLEVRQQAEFLMSLGQTDQALQILQRELEPGAPSNPFVCLDLLELVHSLGQRAEFEAQRTRFEQTFNARVPEFERFADQGRDLEAYPELLARITALWPMHEALEVIDAHLAAQAGPAQPMDLAAYRELLLLHALAHGLAAQADLDLDLNLPVASSTSLTEAPAVDVPLEDIVAPPESGNLIEFDLPSTPPAQR